jgi:hypothetical protein
MGNITTVGMTKNQQFLITIPRTIAQAMRLKKADKLEFLFDRGDVVIRKI